MDAPEPAVSVVIVNYNSGPRIEKCLRALAAQTFRDFEIVIIDNASSDQSLASARSVAGSLETDVRFLEAGGNLGFAAGSNRAVQAARGAWLAFLNPDAYAAPDWLEKLNAARERYPVADAFGSTQLVEEDPSIIDGAGDVYHILGVPYRGHFGWPADQLPPTGECFAPCAAAALYRAETFRALGGFDETFFCYGEDVDLGFRLRLAGGRCIQVADAVVHHEGSGITGRYSDFTVFHGNRNRIWTLYKNMPGPLLWPLLPVQLAANLYLLARSFSVGIGPAYWRAMKAGYGGIGAVWPRRRAVQRARRVSLGELARALSWSPLKVSRRAAAIRPLAREQDA